NAAYAAPPDSPPPTRPARTPEHPTPTRPDNCAGRQATCGLPWATTINGFSPRLAVARHAPRQPSKGPPQAQGLDLLVTMPGRAGAPEPDGSRGARWARAAKAAERHRGEGRGAVGCRAGRRPAVRSRWASAARVAPGIDEV